MNIEITEKEKTALSLLLGLRQKFALAKKDKETYSANELHRLFSETISKINKGELKYLDTLNAVNTPASPKGKVWGEIETQIQRSTIKRYNWVSVFGRSLTQEILYIKKDGYSMEEATKILLKDKRVISFIKENRREVRKILENIRISLHARYGESNTAKKVLEDEDENRG